METELDIKKNWTGGDTITEDALNRMEGNTEAAAYGAWIAFPHTFNSFHRFENTTGIGFFYFESDIRTTVPVGGFLKMPGVYDDGDGGVVDTAYAVIKRIQYVNFGGTYYSKVHCIFNIPGAVDENVAPEETDTFTSFYFNNAANVPDLPEELKSPTFRETSVSFNVFNNDVKVLADVATETPVYITYENTIECPFGMVGFFEQAGDGQLSFEGAYAYATWTQTGVGIDQETITINGRVYEMSTDGSIEGTSDVMIDIQADQSASAVMTAIANAINGDGSATVHATAYGTTVGIAADTVGVAGNFTISTTCTNGSFDGPYSGVDVEQIDGEYKTAGKGAIVALWKDGAFHWTLFGQTAA